MRVPHLELFRVLPHVLERFDICEILDFVPVLVNKMQQQRRLVALPHELHHLQERRVEEVGLVAIGQKRV
jgi:hypothetical protein